MMMRKRCAARFASSATVTCERSRVWSESPAAAAGSPSRREAAHHCSAAALAAVEAAAT